MLLVPRELGQGILLLIVQKGKKNCPLCRKSFSSVLKLRKRRVARINGTTREKESYEEIKVDDIKNEPKARPPTFEIPPAMMFFNPMYMPTGMGIFFPNLSIWPSYSQIPYWQLRFMPIAWASWSLIDVFLSKRFKNGSKIRVCFGCYPYFAKPEKALFSDRKHHAVILYLLFCNIGDILIRLKMVEDYYFKEWERKQIRRNGL